MKIVHKNKSITKNKAHSKESGFVILMGLLILVLGAAAWFGSVGGVKSEKMASNVQKDYVTGLQHVKERMLTYAVLHPEIFDTGTTPVDVFNPGIGYFPCPDTTGDGISDTGGECSRIRGLYGIGWVPQDIVDRHFSFLPTDLAVERKRYWFAVDARFLAGGSRYNYGPFNRFPALNINTPSLVPVVGNSRCDDTPGNLITANCVPPLTLDGRGDIIMVLFYAGDMTTSVFRRLTEDGPDYVLAASAQIGKYLEQPSMATPAYINVAPVTGRFVSRDDNNPFFNDHVIAITREEWNAAMLSRVAMDANDNGIPDLCDIDIAPNRALDVLNNTKNSWFDDCRYVGGTPPYFRWCTDVDDMTPPSPGDTIVQNVEGQGWREALGCAL